IPSLVVAAVAVGCTASTPPPAKETSPIAATIARAELTGVASSFEAGGVVRAKSTAAIASRIMAPILAVHVRPGDSVHRAAALVTLDAREAVANQARAGAALTSAVEAARAAESDIQSAEAAVALAQTTYDRTRTLQEERSATAQELDQ